MYSYKSVGYDENYISGNCSFIAYCDYYEENNPTVFTTSYIPEPIVPSSDFFEININKASANIEMFVKGKTLFLINYNEKKYDN